MSGQINGRHQFKTEKEATAYRQGMTRGYADGGEIEVTNDPLANYFGGALSALVSKGVGAALPALYADGAYVANKPARTEREAKDRREARMILQDLEAKATASWPATADDLSALAPWATAIMVVLMQVTAYLPRYKLQEPAAVADMCQTLLSSSDEAERMAWVEDWQSHLSPNTNPETASLFNVIAHTMLANQISVPDFGRSMAGGDYPPEEDISPAVNPADGGIKMAFGGNVGIALGAAADEWDKQRKLKSDEAWNDARLKLVQPQLNTLAEQEENYRTGLGADTAQKKATIGLLPMQTDNKRLELLNSGADETDKAYGRLNQHFADRDYEGATGLANSLNLPQFGGAKVSSFTHNPTAGATATLDDGRSVLIPQASLDRGTKTLNGGFKFFQDKNTGDIVRTNEKTGDAGIASPGTGAGSRLTLPQQSSNQQIEISRQKIAGMSPEEIRRKTSKATDTGRPNEEYDPTLAQHLRLANKRMYGADPWYDNQGQPQQQTPAQPQTNQGQVNTLASKFSSDPKMKGYSMGNQTVRGIEVKDATGKVIGHYTN